MKRVNRLFKSKNLIKILKRWYDSNTVYNILIMFKTVCTETANEWEILRNNDKRREINNICLR